METSIEIKTPFKTALDLASSRMLSALGAFTMWKWMS